MTFGERLRELRETQNKSMRDLADASGIDRGTISRLESGKRAPSWETVIILAESLDVTPDSFIVSEEQGKKLGKKEEKARN